MDIKVKFWGVRGSIPVPGYEFSKYGGNTSCIEVRCGDTILVLDAGTGIRNLGRSLLKEKEAGPIDLHILISHTHWDHIQGFPFIPQIYVPGNKFTLYGGHSMSSLKKLIMKLMSPEFHPVSIFELAADIDFREVKTNNFKINDIDIYTTHLVHPGLALGYRIEYKGKSIVYMSDNELIVPDDSKNDMWDNFKFLTDNSDVLIIDTQYTPEEYKMKLGWGHSSIDNLVVFVNKYGIKNTYTFHHDPSHTDQDIESMIHYARPLLNKGLVINASKEGQEIIL